MTFAFPNSSSILQQFQSLGSNEQLIPAAIGSRGHAPNETLLQTLSNLQARGRSLRAQQRSQLDLTEPGVLGQEGRRADQMRHDAAEPGIPHQTLDQQDMDRVQIQTQHRVPAFAQHRLDGLNSLRMQPPPGAHGTIMRIGRVG